jgi:hypothetical protein
MYGFGRRRLWLISRYYYNFHLDRQGDRKRIVNITGDSRNLELVTFPLRQQASYVVYMTTIKLQAAKV